MCSSVCVLLDEIILSIRALFEVGGLSGGSKHRIATTAGRIHGKDLFLIKGYTSFLCAENGGVPLKSYDTPCFLPANSSLANCYHQSLKTSKYTYKA